jgi:hypothetical protein
MENKTGKYFKYAIGEIILVVIGILIALSINNWNENRILSNQEHKLLLSLKKDFEESKKRLESSMSMQDKVLNKSRILIEIYQGKRERMSNESILNYIAYGAYGWYRPELLTGSYDAFINTGNSELIKNDTLTKLLAEYFSIVKSGFEDQDNSMNLLNNMQQIAAPVNVHLALPKLKTRIGLDSLKSDKTEIAIDYLFQQDAFFGNLYNKTIVEHTRYTIHEDLMNRIDEILNLLKQELGK